MESDETAGNNVIPETNRQVSILKSMVSTVKILQTLFLFKQGAVFIFYTDDKMKARKMLFPFSTIRDTFMAILKYLK